MRSRRVAVLSVGGTISSVPSGDGGVSPALGADALLAGVPGPAGVEVEAHTLRAVASSDLGWADVRSVARQAREHLSAGADGVVVVQGTDTIEETAFALDLWHDGPEPIVVTGAMRHGRLPGADGAGNLAAALACAADERLRGAGVVVAFGDELHAARWATKVHTSRPAAFASPGCGPLGWVVESRPRLAARPPRLPALPVPSGVIPDVALLPVPLGDDARLLRGVAAAGYAGVVVEALGGGHVPSAAVEVLAGLTRQLPVVLASRCGAGEGLRSTYDFPGSETDLLGRGLVSAGPLSAPKARVLVSLLLASGCSMDDIVVEFCAVRDRLTW